MILSLAVTTLLRAPRRLALEAFAFGFPVAVLAATLGFVDVTVQQMTRVALEPVQVEMRALGTSTGMPLDAVAHQIGAVSEVQRVERFASAAVTVHRPGEPAVAVRLFAVDPAYIASHPWVRMVSGRLNAGLLQTDTTTVDPSLAGQDPLEVVPPGGGPAVLLPVDGQADLRDASTWFQIPAGQVQGDVAVVPRAMVIAYSTFEQHLLPSLRAAAGGNQVTNPGLTDLPPLDVELHIAIDHRTYPADPQQARSFSERLQRTLEDRTGGAIQITDVAAEALTVAATDAKNAKVMFLLLGLPGVLVAAALGLAAAAVLSESYRRERALLELRGATPRQLVRLSATISALTGVVGLVAGLVLARIAVALIVGASAAAAVPLGRTLITTALAILAGVLVVVARIAPDWHKARRGEPLAGERAILQARSRPGWLSGRLDLVPLAIGALVLLITWLTGGLNHPIVEGQTLALAFFILSAPLLLWVGTAVLVGRVVTNQLIGVAARSTGSPLTGWAGVGVRWLGRRPARAMTTMLLGVLAVAAGVEVISFVDTYRTAVQTEAQTAFGSDLRLTPLPEHTAATPPPSPLLQATTPIRYVGARARNGDRKTLLVIDPATYRAASAVSPDVFAGSGPEALSSPNELLASRELAIRWGLNVGDTVTLGVFPDDPARAAMRTFHVAGIYRLMAPASPYAEAAVGVSAFAPASLPAPDFYLARVASGTTAGAARAAGPWSSSGLAATIIDELYARDRRSLTGLSLDGLSTIETVAAALAATLGVGILGAFVVLERGREFAALRAIGIEGHRLVLHPALEMGVVVAGSIVLGLPLGIGLAVVAVRVMPLFFVLPPPLVTIPVGSAVVLIVAVLVTSAVLSVAALAAAVRSEPAKLLRG